MARHRNPYFQRVELNLITKDANDIVRIFLQTQQENQDILGLVAFPALSFFAEESHRYLSSKRILNSTKSEKHSLFVNFSNAVTKVRARIKLIDDTKGGIDGLIDFMELARKQSRLLFSHPASKFSQIILGRFRPDLGVFFIDNRIIATSHGILPTLGISNKELLSLHPGVFSSLGNFLFRFGHDSGSYLLLLKEIMACYGEDIELKEAPTATPSLEITNLDFVAKRFYKHADNMLPITDSRSSTALTLLLSQVNSARFVLPKLIPDNSNLILRIQYLTAYHASRTLRYCSDKHPSWLKENAEPNLELTALRNNMAHYGLGKAAHFTLDASDPFEALIKGHAGINRSELKTIIETRLEQISLLLQNGLTKDSLFPLKAFFGTHS